MFRLQVFYIVKPDHLPKIWTYILNALLECICIMSWTCCVCIMLSRADNTQELKGLRECFENCSDDVLNSHIIETNIR